MSWGPIVQHNRRSCHTLQRSAPRAACMIVPRAAVSFSSSPLSLLVQISEEVGGESGWIGSWSPGIGDPNLLGWLTVVGYLLASLFCWLAYRRQPLVPRLAAKGPLADAPPLLITIVTLVLQPREAAKLPLQDRLRTLWLGLALVLLLLGINKQLDLQTALTEMGRMMARSEGWYGMRRVVQLVFILGVAAIGWWLFRSVLLLARGNLQQMRTVLLGTVFLLTFVTIRATSFHHVDRLLGIHLGGVKLNALLELGGIAFVIHGAWATSRRLRARPASAVVVARPVTRNAPQNRRP